MSSQNRIQFPKIWASPYKKLLARVAWAAGIAAIALLASDNEWSLWGMLCIFVGCGVLGYLLASKEREERKRKQLEVEKAEKPQIMIGVDYGTDGKIATVISERLSDGSLMILDSVPGPPANLEALLEVMMDEPAISAAKDAYAAVKPAADDPYNDTGWDEPWAAAVEAAFESAVETLRQKVW